ncbi:hypothetical protein I302_100079 [Kwoniella bestiolae CBS 10118]|uniref:Uncharacterized protein n=1 Tax=Kwoniella bestiolae CBS 10118 TaxID=1296100 RepID=A0A1B9G461_9TREE|nr:hypothetical protein I302_03451 [Kwoniella bestiolae CBS 10118]OCF25778.1 hypothetical protein I302_03451 [Kwoniella bestiolae CBS 10118]
MHEISTLNPLPQDIRIIILDHLKLLCPLTILQLNSTCYLSIISQLYRVVEITKDNAEQVMAGLDIALCKDGVKFVGRKAQSLSHVERLLLSDTSAIEIYQKLSRLKMQETFRSAKRHQSFSSRMVDQVYPYTSNLASFFSRPKVDVGQQYSSTILFPRAVRIILGQELSQTLLTSSVTRRSQSDYELENQWRVLAFFIGPNKVLESDLALIKSLKPARGLLKVLLRNHLKPRKIILLSQHQSIILHIPELSKITECHIAFIPTSKYYPEVERMLGDAFGRLLELLAAGVEKVYTVTFYVTNGAGMQGSVLDGLKRGDANLKDDDLDNILRIRDIEECGDPEV